VVQQLDIENIAYVQLTGIECDECGRPFEERVRGGEIGVLNGWTVEAVTELRCPYCGHATRLVFEEELRQSYADESTGDGSTASGTPSGPSSP
jgi:DNA-directed RNA polymerase subunit RPC12/RpoP